MIISFESLFLVLIIKLCVDAELVWTRCPCPKILGHGFADRVNACFTMFPRPKILGHGFSARGNAAVHEVSVSQNFGTRICGAPTHLLLRSTVFQNGGTRNLSPGQTTETRNSVSLWQPLWQSHLNVPSGNHSQRQKCTHTAVHVITSSHACSVTRPVGPVKYHVAEGEKRVRGGSI